MSSVAEILEVEGVRCPQCIQKLAAALGEVGGLLGASATLSGDVTIRYDEPSTRAAAVAAIEGAGFPVTGARPAA